MKLLLQYVAPCRAFIMRPFPASEWVRTVPRHPARRFLTPPPAFSGRLLSRSIARSAPTSPPVSFLVCWLSCVAFARLAFAAFSSILKFRHPLAFAEIMAVAQRADRYRSAGRPAPPECASHEYDLVPPTSRCQCKSSPLMLRIFPRKLLLDLRIALLPEIREIGRDLHRPLVRRENLNGHRLPPLGHRQAGHAV